MAPAVANQPFPTKSKKEKEREKREKAAQQQTERLKVVVRRLPPNLPEDVFWQTVQIWVSEETATWKVFYPGKFKKRDNKENIPSRAYVAFRDDFALARFSQEFDGHLFRDKAGNEAYAIVEFAPYQKVPPEKKKPDNKNATIEKDEDYISFIQSLNAETSVEPVTIDSLLAANRPPSPPKTTPLLEALKAEKSAQKDKEAILRNHAHYKDQTNAAVLNGMTGPSRREEKKKVPQAAKQPAPPPTPSKKGKKAAKEAAQKLSASANKGGPRPQEAKGSNPNANGPPKPPRQPKQPKVPAAPVAASAAPVPSAQVTIVQAPKPVPAPVPAIAPPSEGTSGKPTTEPASPTAPLPRRTRPVISNRTFEAALVGAVGARPKRERQEGTTPTISAQQPASLPNAEASGIADAQPLDAKNSPSSPPRPRNRRGGAGPAVPPPATTSTTPAIVQQGPEAVNGTWSPKAAVAGLPSSGSAPTASSDRAGRGGRRGRGRGGGGPARGAPRGG